MTTLSAVMVGTYNLPCHTLDPFLGSLKQSQIYTVPYHFEWRPQMVLSSDARADYISFPRGCTLPICQAIKRNARRLPRADV